MTQSDISDLISALLREPSPELLRVLQGRLLAWGRGEQTVERALEIAGQFHAYLTELRSKLTAREYSELASRLDIGAVGVVALENLVVSETEGFWPRLLLGGLGEGLMVAASRQYIKAWAAETEVVHSQAAWFLSEALWCTSQDKQPDLLPEQRWLAIQSLLAPIYDTEVLAAEKAVLLSRIFQVLLLTHLIGLQEV
ncbi:MAG: hypothetical protein ACUVWZ_00535 [Anaerolineae bacterium]